MNFVAAVDEILWHRLILTNYSFIFVCIVLSNSATHHWNIIYEESSEREEKAYGSAFTLHAWMVNDNLITSRYLSTRTCTEQMQFANVEFYFFGTLKILSWNIDILLTL